MGLIPELADNPRIGRAIKLIRDKHVLQLGKHTFEVRSQSREKAYLINLRKPSCQCEDWEKGHVCKHITACAIMMLESGEALPAIPQPPKPEPVPAPTIFNARAWIRRVLATA